MMLNATILPTRKDISSLDQVLHDKLANTAVSVEYQEVEFSQILADLRENFGLNINVLWGSLETTAGINQDDTVTLMLKQVPLQKALDSILAYVSSGKYAPAKYMIDQGVITIAAEDDLPGKFQVQQVKPSSPELPVIPSTPSSLSSASYSGDRPWQWYLVMEELRSLQQKKIEAENLIQQALMQKKERMEINQMSETHPQIKLLERNIKMLKQKYMVVLQKYEEASMKMRDLEEKIRQSQDISNQLRFLQQQQQQLEQRILDTRIELESTESVPQQKKAESLLQTLQKQRDRIQAEIHQQQEQLQALRHQMR